MPSKTNKGKRRRRRQTKRFLRELASTAKSALSVPNPAKENPATLAEEKKSVVAADVLRSTTEDSEVHSVESKLERKWLWFSELLDQLFYGLSNGRID